MNQAEDSFKKRGVDYDVPTEMYTLPSEYYYSEEIYRKELDRIFYKRWQMACREEEIPNPGDFLVVPVGEESLIVVRQSPPNRNRCRHIGQAFPQSLHR